jgi:hypothetical protein
MPGANFTVDDILLGSAENPTLLVGHSCDGQQWLVARSPRTSGNPEDRCWLCAPASALAIDCVRTGRAMPADAFHHSLTGSVRVIRESANGRWTQSVRLCQELGEDELPAIPRLTPSQPSTRLSRPRPPHRSAKDLLAAGATA